MSTTILNLSVYIEGTDALNAPHLKRADGMPLRTMLVREIITPPAICLGMYVWCDSDGPPHRIASIVWLNHTEVLNLYAEMGIRYYDQGPPELALNERVVVFFDDWIEAMLQVGWQRYLPS